MNRVVSLIVTALSVCLTVSAPCLEIEGFTPDHTPVYKTVGGVELRLHVFTPACHRPADRRPAIVFFFGGGWNTGSPGQFFPHCAYLASRGMVAMSADYRVRKRHQTTPRECVQDGKSAVRWVRQNAGRLGVDPGRVAAGGGSAGGQVAAAAGTLTGFDEPGEDLGVSARPDALVLFNPVFDNGPGGYGHQRVKKYWRSFSPLHNIDGQAPPTVVFLGTEDKLVPVATAKAYQQRMHDAGRRCDTHLYPGQAHGFFNHDKKEHYRQTVIAMDRFLASLGYLEGEPATP